MENVSIIEIGLAKRSFQAHGARADDSVAFRKKLSREKVLAFLGGQSRCVVAMEACGSAHHWGRAISALGHEVRLLPLPTSNPSSNAKRMIRLTPRHDVVAPQGPANVKILAEAVEETTTSLPLLAIELSRIFLGQIDALANKIADLEKATALEAARGAITRRLQTMPGVGRSQPWRSRPSRRRWTISNAAEIFLPGSGSFHGSIRPAESRFSEKPRRWDSATFGACLSSAPWRSYVGLAGRGRRRERGFFASVARQVAAQ